MTRERSVATGVTERGLVTIAIPTFNGARWLSDAIASALGQTYAHTEILVVDDASDDNSPEIAASTGDDRVRVVRNERRLGLAGNWNRCIAEARGEYLKFVFQDDLLDPHCVQELFAIMDNFPSVGLAFSPRSILVEGSDDAMTRRWLAQHSHVHTLFAHLSSINDGRRLFQEQIARDPFRNWIGEPTAVFLRTALVRKVGGFNRHMKQLVDAELWLRLMCHGDVAFVDKPLATFRLHSESATSRHAHDGAAWLDPLWMLDGLLADEAVRAARLPVRALRLKAIARIARGELGRIRRGRVPALFARASELGAYLAHLRHDDASADPAR